MLAVERGQLVERGYIVTSLARSISNGKAGLELVPGLLKRVCEEQCWRARYVESTGEYVEFETFPAFVEAHPPDGLGVSMDTLRKLCKDDNAALAIIERETQRPHGGDRRSERFNVDNINVTDRPTGTSKEQALRKLRTDAPELHRQVLDGQLSPHAAMIEAGFRRKTITVPVDVERAAVTLSRHFSYDELKQIADELYAIVTR